MIPKVRTWRVRSVETGKIYFVETINRRFARWMAREQYGLWQETLNVSPDRRIPVIRYI